MQDIAGVQILGQKGALDKTTSVNIAKMRIFVFILTYTRACVIPEHGTFSWIGTTSAGCVLR